MLKWFQRSHKSNKMKYQLVPSNDHRRNVAEKAIQTFKAHFVTVMCGTATSFPMKLWCKVLRPDGDQLNLLRRSRMVPAVSAFSHLYGQHNYDANPWAPLGTEVELYVTPNQCKTWEAHTKNRCLHQQCPRALQMPQSMVARNKERKDRANCVL